MSKKDVRERFWVQVDGSIYCSDLQEYKVDFTGKTIYIRKSVAFNVGRDLGNHICTVHNDWLRDKEKQKAIPVDMTENISKADVLAFMDELNEIRKNHETPVLRQM